MTTETAGWVAIGGMFVVTYAARIGGYLALRERTPGPWLAEILRLVPLTLFATMAVPTFAAARDATEFGVLLAAALLVLVVVRTGRASRVHCLPASRRSPGCARCSADVREG